MVRTGSLVLGFTATMPPDAPQVGQGGGAPKHS